MRKKLINVIIGALLLTGGIFIGKNIDKKIEPIKISGVYTSENLPENLDIYVEKDEIFVDISDGSFAIINEEKNCYLFYIVGIEDYVSESRDINKLERIINSYIYSKNNKSEANLEQEKNLDKKIQKCLNEIGE